VFSVCVRVSVCVTLEYPSISIYVALTRSRKVSRCDDGIGKRNKIFSPFIFRVSVKKKLGEKVKTVHPFFT